MPTNNPQLDLIAQEQEMKRLLATSTSRIESYYSEANTVFCVGENCTDNSGSIWVDGGDNSTSAFVLKEDPENGLYYFEFLWEPGSLREGDYYLCYTYTPINGGEKITDYIHFYVKADITNDVAIPTHATPPNKYKTLFNAYTPEMYKLNYTPSDKSAITIDRLNDSVGDAFAGVEDQAARIIDILDANVTPEMYLKYLSNFFGISLTTQDPTRWRGQIKKAIPLNKKKGTLSSLKTGLQLSGMTLNEYIQYWQVDSSLGTTSPYFWTESFVYESSYSFNLKKVSIGKNSNFELQVMKQDANQLNRFFTTYALANINLSNINGVTVMTWVGDNLAVGDIVKLTYQLKELPSDKISPYQYFQTLDYQDTRDVQFCDLPPKNWNIRLIDEKDPYFPFLVPVRNPFADPPVFGQIRTVFPYSENIYNMDEYNGSLRDSNNPKDIDNKYMEPCSGGISAHFCLDITIENLGDFSLQECQDIINAYTPFHSVFCHIIFSGSFSDYVLPPDENLDILINYVYDDFMLAGSAQQVFTRGSSHYLVNEFVNRNQLTESLGNVATGTLNIYNDYLNITCLDPSINFNSLQLNSDSTKVLLSINSPSVYAGNYLNAIDGVFENGIRIKTGVFAESPTVLTNTFNYNLYNVLYSGNVRVVDATEFTVTDPNFAIELKSLNLKTKYDVQNGLATAPWKIIIYSNTYNITYVNNNYVYIENDGTLPFTNESNKSFQILDSLNNVMYSSSEGVYQTCIKAKISAVTNGDLNGLASICVLNPNYKIVLQDSYNDRYTFIKFMDENQQSFLIDGYQATITPATIAVSVLQELIGNKVGKFTYSGLKIQKPVSWPAFNDPSTYVLRSGNFPENYLLKLTSGTDSYYKLVLRSDEFDPASSNYVHIDGKFITCGTTSTSSPTSLSYELKKYAPYEDPSALATYDGEKLFYYNRSGSETINMDIYNVGEYTGFTVTGFAPMSAKNDSTISSEVQIKDGIVFTIEYLDGNVEEGELK
jgi:hypothetical protein